MGKWWLYLQNVLFVDTITLTAHMDPVIRMICIRSSLKQEITSLKTKTQLIHTYGDFYITLYICVCVYIGILTFNLVWQETAKYT